MVRTTWYSSISLCKTEYSSNAYIHIYYPFYFLPACPFGLLCSEDYLFAFLPLCVLHFLSYSFVCFLFLKFFFRFLIFVCFVLLPVSCFVILPFNVFRLLVCLCCASRVQYDGMASRCLICLRVLHDGVSLLCQSW